MDFLQGDLSAKKSWFFHETGMVALGAAIHCATCKHVVTSINQEWSRSDLHQGNEPSTHLNWAYANGMGYLISDQNALVAQNQIQKGTWKSLDVNKSADVVQGKVTSLWIEHGANVRDGSYVYSVYPSMSESALLELSKNPDFTVLSNTADIQSVIFPKEKMVQAIFHDEGSVQWEQGEAFITASDNVAIQLQERNGRLFISIADPDQDTHKVKIAWKWGKFSGKKTIRFRKAPYAGTSLTFEVE